MSVKLIRDERAQERRQIVSGTRSGEDELIERAQAGDAEAFCQLARTYQRRIYSLALYYCRDAHDAEDLSQEVWLKAYKALGSFRGDASFYTWLRRIMVNAFLDHRHDKTKRRDDNAVSLETEMLDAANESGRATDRRAVDLETNTHQRILVDQVMRVLDELTAQQRLIFLLKHREGMTVDEIALMLNCSTGTIKKSLFRVIVKLRHHFGIGATEQTYPASSYRAHEIY